MKTGMFVFLIAILAAVFLAAPVQAQQGMPEGECAPGFMLHHMMEQGDHHDHHVGLELDLNQDGFLCVKHLPNGLHVHMDNVVRP